MQTNIITLATATGLTGWCAACRSTHTTRMEADASQRVHQVDQAVSAEQWDALALALQQDRAGDVQEWRAMHGLELWNQVSSCEIAFDYSSANGYLYTESALVIAAQFGSWHSLEYLLCGDLPSDCLGRALLYAVGYHGPQYRGGRDVPDFEIERHYRTDADRDRIVLRLLQQGADPNYRDSCGVTALALAANSGSAGDVIIRALLAAGSDPEIIDCRGQTPAQLYSSNSRHSAHILSLLTQHTDVHAITKQ